jgi:hypothetical protein
MDSLIQFKTQDSSRYSLEIAKQRLELLNLYTAQSPPSARRFSSINLKGKSEKNPPH